MWKVMGTCISMAEGDFGIALPARVKGATVSAGDSIKFTFKTCINGITILEKDLIPVNNAVTLELTEAESGLFAVGNYVYKADWYQDGVFMCNIVPCGIFKVVDKA